MILTLTLTYDSRWIVFSDCHRGDGSAGDEFARNSMVYKFALEHYRKFHDPDPAKTRYIKIWGNHDLDWRDDKEPLAKIFEGIRVYEEAEIACGAGVAILRRRFALIRSPRTARISMAMAVWLYIA